MRLFAALAAAVALAACARPKPGQPPAVRLGQDACARCGMIISEARFGGGWVESDGRSVAFDDDGELLSALADHPEKKSAAFVRNTRNGDWLRVPDAVFERVDGLPTPMGSGYAAFKNPAEAAAFRDALRKPSALRAARAARRE